MSDLTERIAAELRAQGVELADCQTLARAIAALPPIAHAHQMREALAPFAHPDFCKETGGMWLDSHIVYARDKAQVTLGDFRRAAALLASPDAPKETER